MATANWQSENQKALEKDYLNLATGEGESLGFIQFDTKLRGEEFSTCPWKTGLQCDFQALESTTPLALAVMVPGPMEQLPTGGIFLPSEHCQQSWGQGRRKLNVTFRVDSLETVMLPECHHRKSTCLASGSKWPVLRIEHLCASGWCFPGALTSRRSCGAGMGDEPGRLGPETLEGGSQQLLLLAVHVIVVVTLTGMARKR